MAKKKKSSSSTGKKKATSATPPPEERITLEALDAMSSSDEDDIPEGMLNTKAKNLRQAISEGKFDQLIEKLKETKDGDDDDDDDASEMEEVIMSDGEAESDDDDDNDDVVPEKKEEEEEDASGNDSEEEDAEEAEQKLQQKADDDDDLESSNDDGENSEEEEEEDDDDAEVDKIRQMRKNNQSNSIALSVVTAELVATHARLPWAETFDIVPPTPLPFSTGKGSNEGDDDDEEEVVDIHDDLKREVAFYNTALEAVHEARSRCKQSNIPFSRPEDFFAEMVKTDDHMAKVKDKLIFETKKMDAVAQRKSNRENKLRAKESQANRLAEKAKKKKDHFKNVEEWANNAANNRGGALRDDLDDLYLNNRTPGKKRQAADRKYGFGGKRGRFKQNDKSTLNDVSGFNPRGNFAGGMKKSAKSGAGGGRQGKRARDAKRSRR